MEWREDQSLDEKGSIEMRRLFSLLLAAALVLSPIPATAHRQTVESPENPHAQRVDIASVKVRHPRGAIRFLITFYGAHGLEQDGFLRIDFNRDRRYHRYITSRRNSNGSVIGEVRNQNGLVRSYANMYFPDGRSAVVELHRQQLRRRRLAPRMDWNLFATFADESCEIPNNDVVGHCVDSVPAQGGVVRHRF